VEKMAAAARDVIAIRFNMTCLLLVRPPGGDTPRESTHGASVPFRAQQGNSRSHSAPISPRLVQGQMKAGPLARSRLLYAYALLSRLLARPALAGASRTTLAEAMCFGSR